MKRVLDSVHGEILIEKNYFEEIIDTPEFQRLRHIDQSAIRSVFPSARHDRFVHSLGVFHIGSKIAEHIRQQLIEKKVEPAVIKRTIESYKIACLLHDVGHAPFSHTFEKYFGTKKELARILNGLIHGIVAKGDENGPNYHEYTSAIIAISRFKESIVRLKADEELIARMITGLKYPDPNKSLENCFIELLHGEIIDADRIDYACRDVWASGYATAKFDVNRLINAIILDNETGKWEILYKSSVINEIESLLKIRSFQNTNVIGHHTVVYDQHLLLKAVEKSAVNFIEKCNEESDNSAPSETLNEKSDETPAKAIDVTTPGDDAVSQICTLDNLSGNGRFRYLSDADLLHLIKNDHDNTYAEQWFSRNYEHIPLWKTKIEFNLYFPFFKDYDLGIINFKEIFDSVMQTLKIENYLVYDVSIKGDVDLSGVKIQIGENKAEISEVIYKKELITDKKFYFTYIPKEYKSLHKVIIDELRKAFIIDVSEYEKRTIE